MEQPPRFPTFKAVELADRALMHGLLTAYQPAVSELTFSNLFIWRSHHKLSWCLYRGWLLLLCNAGTPEAFAFPPVGFEPRAEVTVMLLAWLAAEGVERPRVERADRRLAQEIEGFEDTILEPARDHFDYVYSTENLIALPGKKYQAKRNHIHRFRREHAIVYSALEERHVESCLEMADSWCELRRCEDDLGLIGERDAVRMALRNYRELELRGGVVLIRDRVEAFSLGELLNRDTAVIHIEKANPEIAGLYTVINQQFCEKEWRGTTWVNREQDLGEPGLRAAKLSYHPDHLVEKYSIRLRSR